MQLIELETGRVIREEVASIHRPAKGESLLDPATEEYNALRKIVRKKSPDLSHTLPYKFDRLCEKYEEQQREIEALKNRLNSLESGPKTATQHQKVL